MRAEIRPTDELRRIAKTIKKLPGKARFGLLMYAEGLRDRYGLADTNDNHDGDQTAKPN